MCVCVNVCVGEGECDASAKCMGHYIQILGSPFLKCIQSGMPPGMYMGWMRGRIAGKKATTNTIDEGQKAKENRCYQ